MPQYLDDLAKLLKPLLGETAEEVLEVGVAKHLDDFLKTGEGSVDDFLKKLGKEGVELSPDARRLFKSETFKFLVEGNKFAKVAEFGENFATKMAGEERFSRADLRNMLNRLAVDMKLAKPGETININNIDLLKNLAKDYTERLAEREAAIGKLTDLVAEKSRSSGIELSSTDIDQIARKKYAEMVAEEAAEKTEKAAKEAAEMAEKKAAEMAEKKAAEMAAKEAAEMAAKEAAEMAGKETADVASKATGKTGSLKDMFNRVVYGGDPEIYANASGLKKYNEGMLYQYTVGALPNIGVSIKYPWRTLWGLTPNQITPLKSFPNFLRAGEKFIQKRINVIDDALKITGTNKNITELESGLRRAIHAFERGTEYDGKAVTKENIGDTIKNVFSKFSEDSDFKESLASFQKSLSEFRNNVRDMRIVDKYGVEKGMTELQQKHLLRLIDRQIETVDNFMKPVSENKYLKELLEEVDTGLEHSSSLENLPTVLKVMINDRLGDLGSGYYLRKTGHFIKTGADGGFEIAADGKYVLGETAGYLEKNSLIKQVEQCTVINETRRLIPTNPMNANIAAATGSLANMYKRLLNENKELVKAWGTGDMKNVHSIFGKLCSFGRTGEILANQTIEYLAFERGRANRATLPPELTNYLGDKVKSAIKDGLLESAEKYNNILKKISSRVSDSDVIGAPRDIEYKYVSTISGLRLLSESEKEVIPVTMNPRTWTNIPKWVWRFGGESAPVASEYWKMVGSELGRGLKWSTGHAVEYDEHAIPSFKFYAWGGRPDSIGSTDWKNMNVFERAWKGDRSFLTLASSRLSGLAPFNIKTKFGYDSCLLKQPFEIHPMRTAIQYGGIYAGANAAYSVYNYASADLEDRTEFLSYVPKLVGNVAFDTIYQPGKFVSKFTTNIVDLAPRIATGGKIPHFATDFTGSFFEIIDDWKKEHFDNKELNDQAISRGIRTGTVAQFIKGKIKSTFCERASYRNLFESNNDDAQPTRRELQHQPYMNLFDDGTNNSNNNGNQTHQESGSEHGQDSNHHSSYMDLFETSSSDAGSLNNQFTNRSNAIVISKADLGTGENVASENTIGNISDDASDPKGKDDFMKYSILT